MKGQRISYSAEEMQWLEANRRMVISDYARAFNDAFGRAVEAGNLHGLRKRKGWKVGRAHGRTAGRRRRFNEAEIIWLRTNCTLEIGIYHAAFCKEFGREDVSADNLKALRTREGWKTGRTGRFEKGVTPANKGKPCPPGTGGRHPNARRTQFKKGGLPHNTKYLGHERINKDGYVEISVAEKNPHTGYERRYVHKHVHLWVQQNGPVPTGHCLKSKDGNKLNTDPSNWELISRATLAALNQRHNPLDFNTAPAELKPAILAIAKLKVASRKKQERVGA